MRLNHWLVSVAISVAACGQAPGDAIETREHNLDLEVLNANLDSPWGLAFLPDATMLVTEKAGRLLHLDAQGILIAQIQGLPKMATRGQGGLMGIAVHPQFQTQPFIYLAYAGKGKGGWGTELLRARLESNRLSEVQVLFKALPKASGGRHFGGRIVIDKHEKLYLSLGDRGTRPSAQDIKDHRGSLIRLNTDGSVPQDNPFFGQAQARPEIFTLGNRNMQGMALHPESGAVWTHEHGPQGGDEVNIMRPGVNYGWPVITYGKNYGLGTSIGEGTHKSTMEQPVYKWVPSIAPSGMSFYQGDAFPRWQDDLLVGSLKFGQLVRLEMDGDEVVSEERIFDGDYGRIRDVVTGPDGFVYLLTEGRSGSLIRLKPVP